MSFRNIPYYGRYNDVGMIESITLNYGANPSVAVIKFPIGNTITGGEVNPTIPTIGSEVYLSVFNFRGTVWSIGDENGQDGSKFKTITVLDYRAELNSKAFYRIYNLGDERAPRGTIIDDQSTIVSYQDTPYTIQEVIDDINSLLPSGYSILGSIIPTFYTPPTGYTASSYDLCPEMRFEYISFVEAIDTIVKAVGGYKWYIENKTIYIVPASGTPTISQNQIISTTETITLGVASKGYKVVGSYELKQMTEDECTYIDGTENTTTRESRFTVDGETILVEEDDTINPIVRASVYPDLYADTNYPLSEIHQWVSSLLDNPADTAYIEAKLKKLKRGIRFASVNFINEDYDYNEKESTDNPKVIKANRLVYYDEINGYDKIVSGFVEGDYVEEKWYRIDANIDHRTGLVEIDYEKLQTIHSISFNAGDGVRGEIDQFGNTTEVADINDLSDDSVEITYKFTADIRATYVYKSSRIQVRVGASDCRANIDDRYRKFNNYNIAETPGYPIYTSNKVDDTDKMAILANQRMFTDTEMSGNKTILIDPSLSLYSNGGIAGITHRPQDAMTDIHYSRESLFGFINTMPEDARRYLRDTVKRSDEANTKSVSNLQDLRLTDTENRIRKEAERKRMTTPIPHTHSGKRRTIKGQRNSKAT